MERNYEYFILRYVAFSMEYELPKYGKLANIYQSVRQLFKEKSLMFLNLTLTENRRIWAFIYIRYFIMSSKYFSTLIIQSSESSCNICY